MGMARCIFNRFLVPSVLMAVGLAGCSLDDDRDLCCPGKLTMHYTYRPFGAEAFGGNIFSLRHFLFGSDGRFIGELPPGEDLRRQPLDLPEGIFTIVTIGNMSERSLHEHGSDPLLSLLSLSHTAPYTPGLGNSGGSEDDDQTDGGETTRETPAFLDNADELFWGVRRFAVDAQGRGIELPPERSAGAVNRLLTQMSNIHCHLSVTVEWANRPPDTGRYTMELDGVNSRYSLDPASGGETSDGFAVPEGSVPSVHRLDVPLRQLALRAEFVTLRLSDTAMPVLRILYGGERVLPDIDLARAFRSWGWHPSATHVQEYRIMLRVINENRVDVMPLVEGSVADWVNGGSFG